MCIAPSNLIPSNKCPVCLRFSLSISPEISLLTQEQWSCITAIGKLILRRPFGTRNSPVPYPRVTTVSSWLDEDVPLVSPYFHVLSSSRYSLVWNIVAVLRLNHGGRLEKYQNGRDGLDYSSVTWGWMLLVKGQPMGCRAAVYSPDARTVMRRVCGKAW